MSIQKYRLIDALRGIAVLGVAAIYTAQRIPPNGEFVTLLFGGFHAHS
jgi:peptidoglycan/LPS O-acetylase OafA/YrhL